MDLEVRARENSIRILLETPDEVEAFAKANQHVVDEAKRRGNEAFAIHESYASSRGKTAFWTTSNPDVPKYALNHYSWDTESAVREALESLGENATTEELLELMRRRELGELAGSMATQIDNAKDELFFARQDLEDE